ncbi:lipopolysaccharide assembly protein LapB [Sulfurisphaera ohwakuensis]|uniref:Tetratricopeptide (TPR) repeat protein n=1 Tax=Sulfurisphaera ohwakuensis TaxID=69656 RepID=A0A650CJL0_SULOH|nr:CDC27 family protein [Sulfurisphaera ohwakuensis]MBB5255023.1 tetratricopeptide (TPR) repeat protein [Sulfurisphaera ohwakuensis]QGR18012.1 tetratricopeptide repeat protein [Sulfurisphaera ohwakuensis]
MEDSRVIERAKQIFEEYKKTKDPSKLDEVIKLLEGRQDLHSLNQLGLVYLEKGDTKKAIEYFEKALRKAKSNEDRYVINFNLALALFKDKDYTRAYEILRELVNTPLKTHAQRLLAKVCLSMGDIKHVEEARAILESFDEPTEDLIVAYIYLGRNSGRKDYLDKAVNYAELIHNKRLLAEALLSYDDKDKIERALEIFRELKDVKGEARALYKLSFYKSELLYEALQKLEESNEGSPQDKIRLLNELYKRTGVIDFLKQAISIAEKEKEYLFLARAYVELSKKENELENLRKAVMYYEEFIRKNL